VAALALNRPADPRVSVVIPAMNEARNLEVILPQLPPVDEVVLVDGESVDDTVEVARRLVPDIKIVNQTRRGKGNALACGFEQSTGDILVMFDADGSADPLTSRRAAGSARAAAARTSPGSASWATSGSTPSRTR
jgi:glycosyltransferase involved in cell wall biosynthesis